MKPSSATINTRSYLFGLKHRYGFININDLVYAYYTGCNKRVKYKYPIEVENDTGSSTANVIITI